MKFKVFIRLVIALVLIAGGAATYLLAGGSYKDPEFRIAVKKHIFPRLYIKGMELGESEKYFSSELELKNALEPNII